MISVQAVHGAAELWVQSMGQALWQSTLVALLVLGAVRLGRRWPAPLRYGLLLVALLKFAVPTVVTSPVALLQLLPGPAAVQTREPLGQPSKPLVVPTTPRVAAPEGPPVLVRHSPSEASHKPSWLLDVLLGVYLLGTMGVLVWIGLQVMRLRRVPSRCTEITEGDLHEMLVDLSRRLGLRRRPQLLLSEHDALPAAFGVFNPMVILPLSLVRELSAAELRLVLAHELAHHRRGDLWLNLLQVGLSAVWWFDPWFWWVSRQLRSSREDCCDDLVLARGLSSGTNYCETLLHAAHLSLRRLPGGTALACGFGAHPLRRRLTRLMQASFRPAAGISPVHGTVLLALGFLLLPGAGSRRAEPRAETWSRSAQHEERTRGESQRPTVDRESISRALLDLDSRDPVQRALAATNLGEWHAVETVPQLIVLLADETPLARMPEWQGANDWSPARNHWLRPSPGEAAAIALASMSQDAAKPLIGALAAPQPSMRRNAAWALGELHHPRLPGLPEVPPLLGTLQDPDGTVRTAAAWALGETKDRRATQPLVTALRDRDSQVRREAAHALGELADGSAAEALLDALEDSDASVRSASSWALGEIRDRIDDIARRRGY